MQDLTKINGELVWANLPPLRIWYPMKVLARCELSPDILADLREDEFAVKNHCFVNYLSKSDEIRYKFPKPVRFRSENLFVFLLNAQFLRF